MRYVSLLTILISAFYSFSQKKIIDHTAYSEWSVIKDYELSKDGKYFAYTSAPYEGNTTLYLYKNADKIDTLLKESRGSQAKFNRNGTFFTAKISGDYFKIRELKIKDTKAFKLPKDTLLIQNLISPKTIRIANAEKYEIIDSCDNIIGLLTHNNRLKNNQLSKGKEKRLKDGYNGDAKTFFIADAQNGIVFQKSDIVDFFVDNEQRFAVLVEKQTKKGKDFFVSLLLDLHTFKTTYLDQKFEKIETVFYSSKNDISFVVGKLLEQKQKRNELFTISDNFTKFDTKNINSLLDSTFVISPSSTFENLKNTSVWLFETQKYEPKKEKDTLLKDEQVKLDVWSWNEPKLRTKQLYDAKKQYSKKFLASYDIEAQKVVALENDTLSLGKRWKNSETALMRSSAPYDVTFSYSYPWKEDLYISDLKSGNLTLLLQGNFSKTLLTPSTEYLYYEKETDTNFYAKNTLTNIENCITCTLQERWLEDLNGMDFVPDLEGNLMIDAMDKNSLWFNSTKGLYRYNPTENKLNLITPKEWLNRKIQLNYYKIEADSQYFDWNNIIVETFDLETKINSYFALNERFELTEIVSGYFNAFSFLKDEKYYYARIQNNEIYPNFNRIENGETILLTDVNPQQKNYNWSTVEPIKWTAYNGLELDGLLYKPENYDSTKQYPLIVYYYETSSEDIHRHVTPRPTASIIFSTEYASSGYFVFMPDIRYEIGHPAKGAYNAIMSGTDYVLQKYPQIDSTRMGLQGQSWGGYQTSQLITMTDRYAAAMAGAPVSNMFSAYGGIRWGSGLSRQFQYEHSQSRIGKTIWEAPELYIENSPLFGLPKVKTPLLIMHNDEDGAVPWYQGIELFMGLRRLQKPAWLLNYNGDDHNLMKKGNRKDLSKRMKDFFDFYLNNGEKPDWITE